MKKLFITSMVFLFSLMCFSQVAAQSTFHASANVLSKISYGSLHYYQVQVTNLDNKRFAITSLTDTDLQVIDIAITIYEWDNAFICCNPWITTCCVPKVYKCPGNQDEHECISAKYTVVIPIQ